MSLQLWRHWVHLILVPHWAPEWRLQAAYNDVKVRHGGCQAEAPGVWGEPASRVTKPQPFSPPFPAYFFSVELISFSSLSFSLPRFSSASCLLSFLPWVWDGRLHAHLLWQYKYCPSSHFHPLCSRLVSLHLCFADIRPNDDWRSSQRVRNLLSLHLEEEEDCSTSDVRTPSTYQSLLLLRGEKCGWCCPGRRLIGGVIKVSAVNGLCL